MARATFTLASSLLAVLLLALGPAPGDAPAAPAKAGVVCDRLLDEIVALKRAPRRAARPLTAGYPEFVHAVVADVVAREDAGRAQWGVLYEAGIAGRPPKEVYRAAIVEITKDKTRRARAVKALYEEAREGIRAIGDLPAAGRCKLPIKSAIVRLDRSESRVVYFKLTRWRFGAVTALENGSVSGRTEFDGF